MYIQVTTKCNMRCEHCMFACAPGSGKHMDYELFRKACMTAREYSDCIVIGGGEPTLHPRIIDMIAFSSFMSPSHMNPFMVTNGTCSKEVWDILMFARKSNLFITQVSKDPWHDTNMIKEWVWDDADEHNLWWGHNGVRAIVPKGRAAGQMEDLMSDAQNYLYDLVEEKEDCISIRIDPDGMVWVDGPLENYRIGELSDNNIDKAYDLMSKLEEENV